MPGLQNRDQGGPIHDRQRASSARKDLGRKRRRWGSPGVLAREILLLMLLAAGSATADAPSAPSGDRHDVMALVNGVAITRRDFQAVYRQAVDRHAREGNPVDEAHIAAVRQTVIRQLVEEELLFQESQRQGIVVSPEALDAAFAAARDRLEEGAGFAQELAQRYMNETQFRHMLHRQLAIERLLARAVAPAVAVTEEEVRAFYETHPDRFRIPEMLRLRHIMVRRMDGGEERRSAARRKIDLIKTELDRGADFADLAERYSEEALGEKGGDLGYVQRGQMIPPLEDAAFSLEKGEVSPIIATEFGYHILKLIDRRPEAKMSLEEARPAVRETLLAFERDQAVRAFVDALRARADIETAR